MNPNYASKTCIEHFEHMEKKGISCGGGQGPSIQLGIIRYYGRDVFKFTGTL